MDLDGTLQRTEYIVIRHGDYPEELLPPGWEGRWVPRLPGGIVLAFDDPGGPVGLVSDSKSATGRFETRDDGARAEVYEVRLIGAGS